MCSNLGIPPATISFTPMDEPKFRKRILQKLQKQLEKDLKNRSSVNLTNAILEVQNHHPGLFPNPCDEFIDKLKFAVQNKFWSNTANDFLFQLKRYFPKHEASTLINIETKFIPFHKTVFILKNGCHKSRINCDPPKRALFGGGVDFFDFKSM